MKMRRNSVLPLLLVLVLLVSLLCPAEAAYAEPSYAPGIYQLTGNMYVRTGPDKSYSSIGAATKGTTIEVFEGKKYQVGPDRVQGKDRLAFPDLFDEDC